MDGERAIKELYCSECGKNLWDINQELSAHVNPTDLPYTTTFPLCSECEKKLMTKEIIIYDSSEDYKR